MRYQNFKVRSLVLAFCILNFAILVNSCSVPNLEQPECTQARDLVKQFYSFHFGNDMHPTLENLKARERFLTSDLFKTLSTSGGTTDYFTKSEEFPKTFKIAKCELAQPDRANVQVQVYWRDDAKTVQKEVNVEAITQNNAWLINNVSN